MGKNTLAKLKRFVNVRKTGIPGYIREDIDILAVILAVALFLRVYSAAVVDYSANPNTMAELRLFDEIALGAGWDDYHPPLYTLSVRLVYSIFGASGYRAVFVLQAVLSSALVPLMYVTGRLMHGRNTGILAAAITALYPNFMIYNLALSPGSFGMIVVALLMTAAVLDVTETGRACLSAVVIGIGMLVNPLLAYLLPGMLITARKKILFIVIAAAILAPWTVRNSVVRETFTPLYEKGAYEIDLGKFSAGKYENWATVHKLYFNASAVLRKGWSGPSSGDDGQMRNSNYAAAYSYFIIMILGLTAMIRYGRNEHFGIIVPIVGYIILLVVFSDFKTGFRMYLELLLILYAAILLVRLGGLLRQKIQRAPAGGPGRADPA
jgi:4-amino-4-deoxy-L-arabinose transferase-like glycosyltransferase